MRSVVVVFLLLLLLTETQFAVAQKDNETYLPDNGRRKAQKVTKKKFHEVSSAEPPDKEKVEIKEACRILRKILLPLEKGIRADILKNLPQGEKKTFSMLKDELGVPASTLYSNLKALEDLGYVRKTDEWPARYTASADIEYVRSIALELKERELERLKHRFEDLSEIESSAN